MRSNFKLRPDIFIQRAPGKLRIHRNKNNFIINLDNKIIDQTLAFLDKLNGATCVKSELEKLPNENQKFLQNFIDFLIKKDLAFWIEESKTITDKNLSLIERYLSQHTKNTRVAYQNFRDKNFLLIADDITLLALLRTFAEFGAKSVNFVISDSSYHVNSTSLIDMFNDNSTCQTAKVKEVKLSSLCTSNPYDVIVGTNLSIMSELPVRKGQTQYCTRFSSQQLILSKKRLPDTEYSDLPAKTHRLIAGSVIGTTIFDDITGVRPFSSHEYAYYALDATDVIRFAKHQALAPLTPSVKSTTAGTLDVIGDLATLTKEPLFPVVNCVQQPHAVDLIAIQKVTITRDIAGEATTVSYYGIGFDEPQARTDALESYVVAEQMWIENDVNYPRILQRFDAKTAVPTLRLVSGHSNSSRSITFSKQAEFIRFCIKTAFQTDISVVVSESEGKDFLHIQAGQLAVHGLTSSNYEQHIERLLLRLYLNLWLEENRRTVVRNDYVANSPLLLTREANNGQSKEASIA